MPDSGSRDSKVPALLQAGMAGLMQPEVRNKIMFTLGMLIIFIGVAVSAGDMKKFGYFVKLGGAGIVFGFVK